MEIKDAKKLRQLSQRGNIPVTKITACAEEAKAARHIVRYELELRRLFWTLKNERG